MIDIILNGIGGKMGRTILKIARERSDCRITAGVDLQSGEIDGIPVFSSIFDYTGPASVAIDFSHPSALSNLLAYGRQKNVPLVIATTGLSGHQIDEIHEAAKTLPIFFSANMSIGINLIAELAKQAAALLGDGFDIEILEKHHNQKIDAPSGTALLLADEISGVLPENPQYTYDRHTKRKKRAANEIGIHSLRGGTITGDHDVIFAGNDEIITISHSARSKAVFAVGCLNAGIFLSSKQPGLYTMRDLVKAAQTQA